MEIIKIKSIPMGLINRFRSYSFKKKIAVIGGPLLAIAIIIPVATYAYYAQDISDRERLMNRNNTGVILTDRHGEAFYTRGVVKNFKDVSLNDISDHVEKALIASEDKSFYTDPGFSTTGIVRAMFTNVKETDLSASGGSGITQQLVKNNLLNENKNYFRKYQELSMAIAIERRYTKNEILEMYLNSVYFGNDAFGIEMAANNYFGKSAKDLDTAESAMLIGLLPAPSAYSPITGDKEMAEKRQEYVLKRMVEEGYLKDEEEAAAAKQTLTYVQNDPLDDGTANHFALMVLDDLHKRYGEERVMRSGFRVKTSLDLGWQKTAQEHVYNQVQKLAAQDARNGSLVAIDPKSGEVRVFVGSADWDNEEFGKVNMATSPRQPGSSFKPIYYTEALETKKITAATILHDEPTDFGGGYRPTNYDFKYRGDVTTRNALANSLNIPAVEVMEKLGVDQAVATAQRMGISTVTDPSRHGLSLALGTAEARLTDMTNAYATFAAGGDQYPITMVTEIKDKFDGTVHQYQPKAKRVMSREASFIISSILSDERARAPLAGSAFNIGRPAAVKTGTTNDNRDAWTLGYTPQLAVGAWVGNNDNQPMKGVGGSLGAGPIWRNTITSLLKDTKAESFTVPPGVIQAQVCTGGAQQEYFIRGTEEAFKCKEKPKEEKKEENKDAEEAKKRAEEERKRLEKEQKKLLEEQQRQQQEEDEGQTLPPPDDGEPGDDNGGGRGGPGDDEEPEPAPVPPPTP